jgi:hypothetical protein
MPDEGHVSMLTSDTIAQDSLSSGSPMYRFVCRSSFTPSWFLSGGSVWMQMIAISFLPAT